MEERFHHLIKKYDFAGPRYTSYPPAPVFTSNFDSEDYRAAIMLEELEVPTPDLSLYVHLPFCDTLCYFCGCTTVVTPNHDLCEKYLVALAKEIDLLRELLNPDRKIVQLHWGGGTPTFLSPIQIERLAALLRSSFSFSNDAEVSVEIDPRGLTFDHMKALRDGGFNRVSLGVQDFDPKVQYAVNRIQSESTTFRAIEWTRALGFQSLNMDLIYGLPFQTVNTFGCTLKKAIGVAPDRLAIYNFAYVPWIKKHQKLIDPLDLPSTGTKLNLLTMTIDEMTDAGYEYIGMDHFARPDDELAIARRKKTLRRNFQGYSTRAGSDLYGLGMSAISRFGGVYSQNTKSLTEYRSAIEKGGFATHAGYRMTFDDRVREYVIMKLMCDLELEISFVEDKFDINFEEYFNESLMRLEPLIADSLVSVTPNEIKIRTLGRLFLRNIAHCFDAYSSIAQQGKPLYSRTV